MSAGQSPPAECCSVSLRNTQLQLSLLSSILSSPATTDCVATAANMKKCILWNWQIIWVKNNGESYCTVGSWSSIQFKDYIWPGVMTCLHDALLSSKICSVRTISMMMNERWWGTGDDDHGLYQLVSARRSVKVGVVVETVSSSSLCFFWVSCGGSFMQAAATSPVTSEKSSKYCENSYCCHWLQFLARHYQSDRDLSHSNVSRPSKDTTWEYISTVNLYFII